MTTFPASEPICSSNSRPSSSTSHKQLPVSSAGHDPPKNIYPPLSMLPYHNQPSEEICSSSRNGPPLPTRISQRQTHIIAPSSPSVVDPEDTHPTSQSPSQALLTGSRNTPLPYGCIPRPGEPVEQHIYSSVPPSERYHHGPHPPPLPSRQSHSRSGVPPSPTRLSEENCEYTRHHRSISTSNASTRTRSPPPHSSTTISSSASGYAPNLPSGATAIIHSPTIPSPKLPLHRVTTHHEPYPLPPLSQGDPRSNSSDPRDPPSRYPPVAPRSPVNYQAHPHSHSRQRSGSSATGWGRSTLPPQHVYYNTIRPSLPYSNDSYGNHLGGAPISSTKGGVGNGGISNETRREAHNAVRSNSNTDTHANHSHGRSSSTSSSHMPSPSGVWWVPQGEWND